MRDVANRPDRLTFWVLALFAVVAPVRAAEPIRVLALIGAMAVVVLAIAAWGARSHAGAIVHDVGSPALCVLGAFELGGSVMYVPVSARWDHALSAVDVRLFGGLPDAWRAALGRPAWLTDAASLAYLSFFAFPVAIGAALYLTGRRREFDRFTFIVLASFFVPYLGYLLMPATGPRVPADREAVLLGGTAISTACRAFFRAGELNVIDAFPSAHTLVSLTTLSFAWRSFPRWRVASCALVAAILFATVFLSFHYVIDLVAGACLALAMPVIVRPLRSFCGPSSARKRGSRRNGIAANALHSRDRRSRDTHLGGDDIDNVVIDWIAGEFRKTSGIDVSKDKMALQRLREAAEKAKIELSSTQETSINLPFLTVGAAGPVHLDLRLSRSKLEQMMMPLIERTMEPVKKALADSKKTVKEIVEVVLVGGSTRIPLVKETVKKFFGKEPHQGVNPDEVVAVGAAVQADVLSGDVKDMILLDVTPLSLGIETQGGVITVMIPRNTTLPTQKKETFSAAADDQPSVEVHVLQGERTESKFNRALGNFNLQRILPAARGVPKIEVMFDVDANGILSVTAKDTATGKGQKITITASSGSNEAEIQKMVTEAAEHEADDKVRREQVERRNKLDNCYTLEKTLRENKEKFQAADVSSLEALIKEGRDAVERQDDSVIAGVAERVEKEAHRLASAMYAGAGDTAAANEAAPKPPKDRGSRAAKNVVDAEFEDTPRDHP